MSPAVYARARIIVHEGFMLTGTPPARKERSRSWNIELSVSALDWVRSWRSVTER